MSAVRWERVAQACAGAALALLALMAVLPALVPALRDVPAQVAGACRAALVAGIAPLDPIRPYLALVPIGLALIGLLVALVDRVRQQNRLGLFLRAHQSRALGPGDPLYAVAAQAGVQHRVRVLEGRAAAPAFTAGFLRPRVYFSQELFHALTPAELGAAFEHEMEHLRRRDPLRLAFLRFVERALFWIPLARALADAAAEAIEFRADDAARRAGYLNVAAAIVKAARLTQTPAPEPVPSLGRISVSRRARRLLGESLPRPRIPTVRLAATALLLSLVWASALFAGRLHAQEGGAPCNACVLRHHIAQWLGTHP